MWTAVTNRLYVATGCCFVTPLMMAAESGCADSVRLLLQQVRVQGISLALSR